MMELQTAWGWQAALYLFLGGLGAGMFVVAAALDLVVRKHHRTTITLSFWIAAACLTVGLGALLLELINPARALLMGQSFSHLSSWMARGAWGVSTALIVFFLTAALSTKRITRLFSCLWKAYPGLRKKLRRILFAVGTALAVFVMYYTGALLSSASGVPFWNSFLLPCLFIASAAGAGINGVVVVDVATGEIRKIKRHQRKVLTGLAMAILVVEIALLLAYVLLMASGGLGSFPAQRLAAAASAHLILEGDRALVFWVFMVGIGIGVPFATFTICFFLKGKKTWKIITIGAVCTLIGDAVLRVLVLSIGMQADHLGQALSTMI